ncbi:glycosyltransferase [Vibrio astriarenae]|uniref:Glycosyltransferase n=1 Tax=Vibrio astriarenae TaxID=1481923 RepID=A0A7Z2T3K3_9VIBR|nr:glycosyltransferase [Vibrio astriarenae]QIA63630.1 glycosyltransferase [Vibrio astriarenae]
MTKKIPLLIVHYGDNWIRGSEVCLMNMIDSLDNRYVPIVWTNNPAFADYAEANHIIVEQSEFPELVCLHSGQRKIDWNNWCLLFNKARYLIRKHHIKLIHVNSGAPCQWMASAARATHTPIVAQLHCEYNLHDRFTLGLHTVPNIITVSHAISQSLLEEGYEQHRLHVVHNGVPVTSKEDIEPVNIREELGINEDAKIILSVGSLIERKGVDRLISTIYRLREEGINAHLVVIGDGECKTLLEQFAQAINVEDYVHLIGEQNNVNAWLHGGANLFISGARSEAFGLVLVEAALAGIPVIAPATGGIVEVIKDRKTGLLYPNNKDAVEHITQRATSILYDQEYGQELAAAGLTHAQQHFSVENNVSHIEAVYEHVLLQPGQHKSVFSVFRCALRPLKTVWKKHIINRFFVRGARYENC